MNEHMPSLIAALYGISELIFTFLKRSKSSSKMTDRGSLWIVWAVIMVSMGGAFYTARAVPAAKLPYELSVPGLMLFVAGLGLRWYAIIYLGRFFTTNVSIQSDHRVVDSGPYRLVRHPGYAGAMLSFAGLGFCLLNTVSLIVLVCPIFFAYKYRIRIEEAALNAALGGEYRRYAFRTKRLIPFVY